MSVIEFEWFWERELSFKQRNCNSTLYIEAWGCQWCNCNRVRLFAKALYKQQHSLVWWWWRRRRSIKKMFEMRILGLTAHSVSATQHTCWLCYIKKRRWNKRDCWSYDSQTHMLGRRKKPNITWSTEVSPCVCAVSKNLQKIPETWRWQHGFWLLHSILQDGACLLSRNRKLWPRGKTL